MTTGTSLPAPFLPPYIDLSELPYMPMHVQRVRESRFAASADAEHFRAGLMLWCASWHQVPAGSLPDDDIELAALAGFGRVIREWKRVRDGALYRWKRCSDGRLYHPIVCEVAASSYNSKVKAAWKKECDRTRKENAQRKQRGEEPAALPTQPAIVSVVLPAEGNCQNLNIPQELPRNGDMFPSEDDDNSDGNDGSFQRKTDNIPAENALKLDKGSKKERTKAKALDAGSVAQADFLPPPSPPKPPADKGLWGKPLVYLVKNSGKTEANCRKLIGEWRRDHGDQAVEDAVTRAQIEDVSNPVAFIIGCLSKKAREAKAPDRTRYTNGDL